MGIDSERLETLDILIRGLIETEIDSITPETMENWVSFKEVFPLSSLEDFIFGSVLGVLYCKFRIHFERAYRREPDRIETNRFFDIIERRTMEIRGKIKLAINR